MKYIHTKCQIKTTATASKQDIANKKVLFCVGCNAHKEKTEFTWEDDSKVK